MTKISFKEFLKSQVIGPDHPLGRCIEKLVEEPNLQEHASTDESFKQFLRLWDHLESNYSSARYLHKCYQNYIEAGKTKAMPIYKAKLTKTNTVWFKCPVCKVKHQHGRGGMFRNEISHRLAHCIGKKLYNEDGYYIWFD